WLRRVLVLNEVAELTVALVTDGPLQRDGVLAGVHHAAHAVRRQVHLLGDLLRRRAAPKLLLKHLRRAVHLADALGHVQGDADCARLLRERPRDRLPDPPRGVRAEAVAALVIIL